MSLSQRSDIKYEGADHIYYSTTIYNNPVTNLLNGTQNTPVPANFSETRTQAIINDPENWHVAIVRFTVPVNQVPIFYWPGDTTFSVTLSVGTDDYQTNLTYVSIGQGSLKPIVYFQQMVDLINTAFSTSWTALKAGHGGVSSNNPPFMIYTASTNLFTLYVPQTYVADSISVYMNYALYQLFGNIQAFFNGNATTKGKDYKITVENQNNLNSQTVNSVAYYYFTQEFESTFYWEALQTITFYTNSLPIVYDKGTPNVGTTQNSQTVSADKPILTDFEPINSGGPAQFKSYLQYQPDVWRVVDMRGGNPIFTVDYRITWSDNAGNEYPINIPLGESVTVKFLFIRKNKLGLTIN